MNRRRSYKQRKASPLYHEWWNEANTAGVYLFVAAALILAAWIVPHCL